MKRFVCVLVLLSMLFLCGCGQVMEKLEELAGDVLPGQTEAPTTEPYIPDPDIIPNWEDRWFLSQLDEEQLANVCMIYECAMEFEEEVTFPYPMSQREMSDLFFLLRYECPELMQVDHSGTVTYSKLDGKVVSMTIPYCMEDWEYAGAVDACMAVIDVLVENARGLDDWEKEALVYEYINEYCTYTTETENAGTAYGCLAEGKAKCDGISYAVKWALEEMGVNSVILSGDPPDGGIGHAWNVVELDGRYYDLDVTADVRREGEETPKLYAAYNVDDEWVRDLYILDDAYEAFTDVPGTGSMKNSFYAQQDLLVYEDEEPDLESLFLNAYYETGFFSLQFEDQDDYDRFCEDLEGAVDQIARDNSLPGYRWKSCMSNEYRVIRVDVSEYE